MTRRRRESVPVGHDSFLDIVSNMVGILILLVMVTGVRVKNVSYAAEEKERLEQSAAKLDHRQEMAASLRKEMVEADRQITEIERRTTASRQVRDQLATLVAAVETKLKARRSELDADQRQQFDLTRQADAARRELKHLDDERRRLEASKPQPVVIRSLPTPLSKTVDDREEHFRLMDGRLTYIPLERLIREFRGDAQRRVYRLEQEPEMTGTVGPYGGFRLRYTLKRYDTTPEMAAAGEMGSYYVRLSHFTLIPTADDLGEPLNEALAEGSRFRRLVAGFAPQTTITVWTYADSFDEFRRLKKELFRLGFATAARPLPLGAPIQGAPSGSKSAAE